MEHELGTDPKKWSVFILKQVGMGSWSGLLGRERGLQCTEVGWGINKDLEPFTEGFSVSWRCRVFQDISLWMNLREDKFQVPLE